MELERQVEPPKEAPKPQNPARKWLFVSAFGLVLCLASLGLHAIRGGGGSVDPLPTKVLSQVFGFTPYYFAKDTPPDHLRLQTSTPKFLGNALTFKMTDSRQESISVSEKAFPTPFKNPDGESITTNLGTAIVKTGGGRISAAPTTKDKTYITLDASDFITSGTFIDVYNNLTSVQSGAAAIQQ